MKTRVKFGKPPGTVIYAGERSDIQTKYELVHYNSQDFLHKTEPTLDEIKEAFGGVRWLLIKGLADAGEIQRMLVEVSPELPSIILEDIVNVEQRPHLADRDGNICVILKYWNLDLVQKQISVWFTPEIVISFQETHDDLFQPIFDRINSVHSESRHKGTDRLVVVLIDFIIDLHFTTLDLLAEKIAEAETRIVNSKNPSAHMREIYELKNTVQKIEHDVRPIRELVDALLDDFDSLFTSESRVYLKDVGEHLQQILAGLDSMQNTLSVMVDLIVALNGNRTNEIMRVLTVTTFICLPLSLFMAYYGTNFKDVPFVDHPYAGRVSLLFMLVLAVYLFRLFRKKDWL